MSTQSRIPGALQPQAPKAAIIQVHVYVLGNPRRCPLSRMTKTQLKSDCRSREGHAEIYSTVGADHSLGSFPSFELKRPLTGPPVPDGVAGSQHKGLGHRVHD